MRFSILIIGLLLGGSALADTVIRCRTIVAGAFPNTAKEVNALDLISYVDHFSLTNTLAMKLDSSDSSTIFTREFIKVDRQTQMRFVAKKENRKSQQVWIHIDRSPREARETRTFQGILFIAKPRIEKSEFPNELNQNDIETLNFECNI
ncbi:MAG: hypothetical protein K2P81_15870 [Bacteriovoracaceae bacterium]|nr:hypothetical protein [Bacteriovoracaceae bacterium]